MPRWRAGHLPARVPYVPQAVIWVLRGARLGKGSGVGLETQPGIRPDAPRSLKAGCTVKRMRAIRRLLPPAFAVPVAVMMIASAAGAAVTVQTISTDTLTSTIGQHQTEVEPDTLANGSKIVSGFQVGRIYNGGSAAIGWATSNDGGANWSHGLLPGLTQSAPVA